MISIKRLSAVAAITCGVLFTITALLSIWEVGSFCLDCQDELTHKLLPSLALLTASFIVLLVILKVMEEKK